MMPRDPITFINHGQKLEPHRLFVRMAEALAQAGYVSLRFDFRGSGNSDGDLADMTLAGELDDALAAWI